MVLTTPERFSKSYPLIGFISEEISTNPFRENSQTLRKQVKSPSRGKMIILVYAQFLNTLSLYFSNCRLRL